VIAIKYKHVKSLQHNIGNGITEPKFAVMDDNTQAVVKTMNGPEGNLVLFNEYFCYRLAILLDIKMPVSGICVVDGNTEIMNDSFLEINRGFGFYSTYLPKAAVLVDTIISVINNKQDFYKLLLFDHVIFNTDRNPGNLLVQYYKSNITLRVIDHSHVFINQAIWDTYCLQRGIEEKDYYSTRVMEENEYLYSMFMRTVPISLENLEELIPLFRSRVTIEIMKRIVEDIPKEWRPSDRDIDALYQYLLYRLEHLEDICITIYRYIKE